MNKTGAKVVAARLAGGQRGEVDFGRTLTSRTLVLDIALNNVPKGSRAFPVTVNQFVRDDDAALAPGDITASGADNAKVLVLTVCFDRHGRDASGDPGSYSGSVTVSGSRLTVPLTVPRP